MREKIGVIISIENYQSSDFGLSKVEYATNDSEEMKKIFVEVFGINETNIYYYKDEQFTCAVGKSELQYYLNQIPCNAEVYLYYAGHGFFCEGKNYLTTYDTSTLDIVETSLSFEDLFLNSFRRSGAKSCVAFIDACAEGISVNQRNIVFRGIDMTAMMMEAEATYRYALYFACSPKEKSISDDELQHGVWTYFLINALRGDERAYDQGKYISTTSLEKYLRDIVNNYTKTKNNQTPYSVISTNDSWKLVEYGDDISFEEKIYIAYDEFLEQCNFANQELDIGGYGDIHNFAQARDLCWDINKKLCSDWDEIVTSLEFYFNLIRNGREIKLTYIEQKELLNEFERLIRSFPTYVNNL